MSHKQLVTLSKRVGQPTSTTGPKVPPHCATITPSATKDIKKPNSAKPSAHPGVRHAALFEYMEMFYNCQWLHSRLGYLSPIAFEQQFGSV
jgi:hypothetical protein